MKRFLFLFTAAVLSCVIFASCRTGGNSGTSPNEPIDTSESVSENEDVSGSENSDGNVSGSESVSEDESVDREEGLFYITLDYRGFDDKNEVKKITVKKGEKITGLPEKVNSSSNSDFEYWAYNGKKTENGMVYDYDFDITVIACYAEWTDNY